MKLEDLVSTENKKNYDTFWNHFIESAHQIDWNENV